jgi:hypothetical protein
MMMTPWNVMLLVEVDVVDASGWHAGKALNAHAGTPSGHPSGAMAYDPAL